MNLHVYVQYHLNFCFIRSKFRYFLHEDRFLEWLCPLQLLLRVLPVIFMCKIKHSFLSLSFACGLIPYPSCWKISSQIHLRKCEFQSLQMMRKSSSVRGTLVRQPINISFTETCLISLLFLKVHLFEAIWFTARRNSTKFCIFVNEQCWHLNHA